MSRIPIFAAASLPQPPSPDARLLPLPAHATSTEMIELQTQVKQLLDMVQRLQSTLHALTVTSTWWSRPTTPPARSDNGERAAGEDQRRERSQQRQAQYLSGQLQSLNDSVDQSQGRALPS